MPGSRLPRPSSPISFNLKALPFLPAPKSCTATKSTTMHLYRFSLSAEGQPSQNLPSTETNLPIATAVFGRSGQNPADVSAFCADRFPLGAMARARG